MKEGADGFHGADQADLAADPFQRLMNGIRIGEDVMGGFPVGMLVGGAEARHPERRRIGECSPDIGGRGSLMRCGGERIDIVAGSSASRLSASIV